MTLNLTNLTKVMLAISCELELGALLEQFLHMMMDHADAERGFLLLQEDQQLYIEASGLSDRKQTKILDHTPSASEDLISQLALHNVERSQVPIVLESAFQEGLLLEEPYIQKHQVRSLLCMPILYKNQLTGILYLENNLRKGAFSSECTKCLQILCDQAGISIKNAQERAYLLDRANDDAKKLRDGRKAVKQAHKQLVQFEKMASLGTLVSGVAHEINNPAHFTYTGAHNLQRRVQALYDMLFNLIGDLDEENAAIHKMFDDQFLPLFQNLDAIIDGTDRIKDIVRDLRTFSRTDGGGKRFASIITGLKSTLSLVRANYKSSVRFVTDFQSSKEIECWPAQLNQVFMNIMVNGSQAIQEKLEMMVSNTPGTFLVQTYEEDGMMVILFKDYGAGMSEEVQRQIFEPFYTTKTGSDGMGLGLAITFKIIKEHGGRIEVKSKLGEGTSFFVFLPLARTSTDS